MIPENQISKDQSACGLFQKDTVVAEIVDDPKIPENQVPKDQSACSLFQKDTGVALIVDDPKVPETQVPRNRKFLFEIGITNSVLFLRLHKCPRSSHLVVHSRKKLLMNHKLTVPWAQLYPAESAEQQEIFI